MHPSNTRIHQCDNVHHVLRVALSRYGALLLQIAYERSQLLLVVNDGIAPSSGVYEGSAAAIPVALSLSKPQRI